MADLKDKTPTEQAEALLNLAATYAGDGGINTAIDYAKDAIVILVGIKAARTAWMNEAPAFVKQPKRIGGRRASN